MAVWKCKMCGGNVSVQEGKALGTCEYCGNTMTLPRIEDEQRAALYNRGNHLRMKGEYDRALAVFEQIIALDDTDAEAHWNIVLCRYGIEYVEDPDTHKHIATCHRASWESILEDVDYLAALRYADPAAKEIYEREGKYIDEVQRGILAISRSEAPYDIFICYKETTEGGSRTKDSVYAQDLYSRLSKEGYRVFFARITLEDKLGQQYEPYIFSALNSAKVMLVVGTSADNFNAPWVRNEWSRFLTLMKKDTSKLLIPCYRDMDAYELPDELAIFQSQDMGKIGFEQDLLHGISKVLEKQTSSATADNGSAPASATVNSLLKRAEMFLSDCNWKSAREYYDRILDIDPERAEAHAGKLCALLEAPNLHALGSSYISNVKRSIEPYGSAALPATLDQSFDYKNAVQYASPQLRVDLEEQDAYVRNQLREFVQSDLEVLQKDLSEAEEHLASKQANLEELRTQQREEEDRVRELTGQVETTEKKRSTRNTVIYGIGLVCAVVFLIIDIGGTAARRDFGFFDFIIAGLAIALVVGVAMVVCYIISYLFTLGLGRKLTQQKISLGDVKDSLNMIQKQIDKAESLVTQQSNRKQQIETAIEKKNADYASLEQ